MNNLIFLYNVVFKVLKKGDVLIKDFDLKNIMDDYLISFLLMFFMIFSFSFFSVSELLLFN